MEVLAVLAIAYVCGIQSEQNALDLAPVDRAARKEQVRHQRAVEKIARKHPEEALKAPLTDVEHGKGAEQHPACTAPSGSGTAIRSIPVAFRNGYSLPPRRNRFAVRAGETAGRAAATGVMWAANTGRSAVSAYRDKRTAKGEPDPAPVVEYPPKPDYAPDVTAGEPDKGAPAAPDAGAEESGESGPAAPDPEAAPGPVPESPAEAPRAVDLTKTPDDTAPTGDAEKSPETKSPETDSEKTGPPHLRVIAGGTTERADMEKAEVTYDDVLESSDDLTAMCDDDLHVYDRMIDRCDREIGKGDELLAQLEDIGAGDGVLGWIARGLEKYGALHAHFAALKEGTAAQSEAVILAKETFTRVDGLRAQAAKDQGQVAERDYYYGDAAPEENDDSDTYETSGSAK